MSGAQTAEEGILIRLDTAQAQPPPSADDGEDSEVSDPPEYETFDLGPIDCGPIDDPQSTDEDQGEPPVPGPDEPEPDPEFRPWASSGPRRARPSFAATDQYLVSKADLLRELLRNLAEEAQHPSIPLLLRSKVAKMLELAEGAAVEYGRLFVETANLRETIRDQTEAIAGLQRALGEAKHDLADEQHVAAAARRALARSVSEPTISYGTGLFADEDQLRDRLAPLLEAGLGFLAPAMDLRGAMPDDEALAEYEAGPAFATALLVRVDLQSYAYNLGEEVGSALMALTRECVLKGFATLRETFPDERGVEGLIELFHRREHASGFVVLARSFRIEECEQAMSIARRLLREMVLGEPAWKEIARRMPPDIIVAAVDTTSAYRDLGSLHMLQDILVPMEEKRRVVTLLLETMLALLGERRRFASTLTYLIRLCDARKEAGPVFRFLEPWLLENARGLGSSVETHLDRLSSCGGELTLELQALVGAAEDLARARIAWLSSECQPSVRVTMPAISLYAARVAFAEAMSLLGAPVTRERHGELLGSLIEALADE